MPTRKFPVTLLRDDWGILWGSNLVHDEITHHSRWSVHHEAIILAPDDKKYYRVQYSEGATEHQDESPWEYDDEIIGTEVEFKQVTTGRWVNVFDGKRQESNDQD